MASNPVILLELNELCPHLLEKFISSGYLPNFKKLRDRSAQYISDADVPVEQLEPWIQWVTVHSGLAPHEHNIKQLDEGHTLKKGRLWDYLSSEGYKVWVCGSMNVGYETKSLSGMVLPDPWSEVVESYPKGEFDDFLHFVQLQVREYTNNGLPMNRKQVFKFLKFLLTRGIRFSTILAIGKQLIAEKVTGRGRWLRACILDRLQWDVFSWYYKRHKPDFSTFFLNSVAHFQHVYWRNMEPEKFLVKPGKDQQEEFSKAILTGYQRMDKIIGQAIKLAGKDTTIVFCTGLSQQPCTKYESEGGKRYYRLSSVEALMSAIGVSKPYSCAPVMSEQFRIRLDRAEDVTELHRRLMGMKMGGREVFSAKLEGKEIFLGCQFFHKVEDGAFMEFEGRSIPFYDVFYLVEETKSGMHHPDGVFWISGKRAASGKKVEKVPLINVAPTILDIFGVSKPSIMRGESVLSGGL